jgi:hypothetical protein
MKSVTTGLGLCVLGVGIAAYPVLDHLVPRADAGVPRGAAAIVASATAQVEPTIVWYQVVPMSSNVNNSEAVHVYRAWSDGRMEMMRGVWSYGGGCTGWYASTSLAGCPSGPRWHVVSSPSQGLTYRSDINFDSKVDGADLGTLLADWGDAPRRDILSSDCPLNLLNP